MTDTMTNKEAIDILRVINPPRESKRIFDEFIQARNMAIKALEKQEKDRWIPVSERLPEEDCECRVTFKSDFGKSVFNCYWNEGKKQFEDWDYFLDCFVPVVGVIAWKLIEEPYTEDEDGEQKSGN